MDPVCRLVDEIGPAVNDKIQDLEKPRVACYLKGTGPGVVITEASHIYIKPNDRGRETITERWCEEQQEALTLSGTGWSDIAIADDLGGFRAGGKVVISHLQRQWQTLESWQRLTGSKRCAGPCPIVGSLERLLVASGRVVPRVQLNLTGWGSLPSVDIGITVEARAPDSGPSPAADKLCHSLTQFVICRLDNDNGPTNRAVAKLDRATMLRILELSVFPGLQAPKDEKALLRMAVDWSSQPWRSVEAIEAVMAKIKFAGAPAAFEAAKSPLLVQGLARVRSKLDCWPQSFASLPPVALC